MNNRSGEAVWEGSIREGKGRVKLGSGAFEGAYSFGTRFAGEVGTNPEELLGAAHAACFSMQLAANLGRAGYPPQRIHTTAKVSLDKVGEGFQITHIHLDTEAQVAGIDEQTFLEAAHKAETGCPVSQALAAVEISLDARLMH